jgi:hypothetical protein
MILFIQNQYFIRIRGEVGWVYVLGYVDGQSAFVNELVPGDFILYVNGHSIMRPITWEQYKEIYDALTAGSDPTAIINKVLQSSMD